MIETEQHITGEKQDFASLRMMGCILIHDGQVLILIDVDIFKFYKRKSKVNHEK
ncbi:MAG: hypothetical protein QY310_02210 [Candidatus Jettenia sp. CY-1]|nr:hypothetical protein [Candidatus Jettenia sp.]WKZ19386.1 MAG: hypothetical protein QY310_02210 [Candidatus Jettenia sp. CY-1]